MIDMFKKFLADKEAPDMFITGMAGTGKTTSLANVIQYCIDHKINTVTCAFTHKACGVLRNKIPLTNNNVVCTLHKFLKKRPTINTEARHVKDVDGNAQAGIPDRVDLLIIDEFSMVGERDYVDIAAMMYDEKNGELKTKVLYVGDMNQLPPVRDMQTLFPKEPYWVKLTHIYRQEDGNKIIDTLVKLNEYISGKPAMPLSSHENMIRGVNIVEKYKEQKEGTKVILAYTNECVQNLNEQIQGYNFPLGGDNLWSPTVRKLYTFENARPDANHVIDIKNQVIDATHKYKALDTLKSIEEISFFELVDEDITPETRAVVFGHYNFLTVQKRLVNIAVKINQDIEEQFGGKASHWAKSNWQHPMARQRAQAWKQYLTFKDCVLCIDFAHAMTVHKSQGSTYDYVYLDTNDIGICSDKDYGMYLRLMYVAISRAAKTVYTN